MFAGSWPKATDPADRIATALNTRPKFVASTTLGEVTWSNSILLRGDVAQAVARLKAQEGDEVQVHGSGQLIQTLLRHDLVDTLRLWQFPVVLGTGKRLFGQGTIPRGPAFFDPELQGRWGAARLAEMSGAPVIPIGLWGTERVWPRSSRVPAVWNVLRPPTIRVRVGPPVEGLIGRSDADTATIMQAIAALLPREARERRTPTPEELARTYPPGKAPTDGEHESSRRPGRD